MTKQQDRYDRHELHVRNSMESTHGLAITGAGWEIDTIPIYSDEGTRDQCQVIAWHAITGRIIQAKVVEEWLALELVDIIAGHPVERTKF